MRIKQALAIGATLVALTSVTACDGDESAEGRDGGNGGANTAEATEQADKSALPEAADVASIARYVKQYTSCESLQSGEKYDSIHSGSNDSWGAVEAADPSWGTWGIKERAVCTDASGHPVTLLSLQDIKKFQNSAKRDGWEFLAGSDFAVVPFDEKAYQDLQKSDLKYLTCESDFTPLSGFTKEPAAVDGCVLSNYFPS
ncbi:hypothetical protein [Streptomyces europaeiscabiei]|uniref:hypothetical protein n=1 Tax=Streptomyces europaeiscabiei TaxID=146819 RepID=UPI0029A971FF|nr:hypothetical protein [Streptomyces europaeiscabiei]MDX2772571.1 hypothetical protein [Streptomyces europaeiscabiei]MDX3668179.1 hypothetical protein [Streptomyces europaeiscabiei]MDX3708966.1 hypothetical protein [Streptomyces europaeiscabiei]MDX3777566.1 hypothetical protein [Streptomyces europaeiscabiei]MDX3831014.1 hypothetical protein [Streptomyces europaeiscabiei]